MAKATGSLRAVMMLAILVVLCGCGGGSSVNDTSAKVSIVPAGSGEFIVQGDNMDGVAAIHLTIAYDSATLASPTIHKGSLVDGALMVANPNNPGTIRIAIVTTGKFAGSGQIATISFASVTGNGVVSVTSIKMASNTGSTLGTEGTVGTAPPSVTSGDRTSTTTTSSGQPAVTGTVQ